MEKVVRKFDPEKIKDFQTWDELSKEMFSPSVLEDMEKKLSSAQK